MFGVDLALHRRCQPRESGGRKPGLFRADGGKWLGSACGAFVDGLILRVLTVHKRKTALLPRAPSSRRRATLESRRGEMIEQGESDQQDEADGETPADQLFLDRQKRLAVVAAQFFANDLIGS